MMALTSAARMTAARLARSSSAVAFVLALVVVALVSLLERRASAQLAADHALSGVALGLALPLLAYGTVARALEGARLEVAVQALARYGANRRVALIGVTLSLMLALALSGALLALSCVVVTRAPADPRLMSDLATSSWIGALAGASYAAAFLLGSSVGARGGGRFWMLVLDFALGAGTSAVALPWPRGHVRNLLGAEPVMAMPQWGASLALSLLCLGYVGLCWWRTPR